MLAICACAHAEAQQTKAQMNTYNNTVIVPNGTGAITAANLHPLLQNMINSSCTIADPVNCPISALSGLAAGVATALGVAPNSSGGMAILPFSIAPTNQFFQNSGAVIQRLNDRVFVAGAAVSDGSFPSSFTDWLATYQLSISSPVYDELSQMNVLTNPAQPNAQTAFLAADQSLHKTGTSNSIGGTFFGINNNTTLPSFAWSIYAEAQRSNSTVGQTNGIEAEVRNAGGDAPVGPFTSTAFASTPLEAGCGAGLSSVGEFNCSSGLMVFPNPMPFDAGILFLNGSVATSFGGQKNAIVMPPGYVISWINASNVIQALVSGDSSGDLVISTVGTININGHLAVSCAAGAVTLASLVVTNGIITHC
jgi:hypothetical protein